MAAITEKIHYRKDGVTTDIGLYDSTADVGSDYIGVKVGGATAYAMLGDAGEMKASDLKVRKGGITYSVMTENQLELPSGFIAMFDSTVHTDCPTGWVREGGFDDKFIRGAAVGGGTGGSPTHVHDFERPSVVSGPYDNSVKHADGSGATFASLTHTHNMNAVDIQTESGSSEPPHFKVIFCRKV